ncbi:MAG: succinylglutamate desuccinylase/aspartoacylase family protein, partial [Abditibacteriaceae bacterium]
MTFGIKVLFNTIMINRIITRPAGLDLDSPGRRDYYVALEHDTLWGDHLIPLTVWVGAETEDNKGLVAFGSTHGNEIEGPVALRHLLDGIKIEDVRGRIILIPILNPAAFKTNTRDSESEDGVNLNRAFVDDAGHSPALSGITHRIADFVRKYIWPK